MRLSRQRKRKRGVKIGPRGAGSAIGSVLKSYGIAKEVREHRLIMHWHKVVGPRIAGKTTPDGLDKGVLWVRVDSSAWMHQLSFLRAEIVEKANELCGSKVITDVRFHLGRRKNAGNDPVSAAARIRRAPLRSRQLPPAATGAQLAQIKSEAAGIDDAELRDLVVETRRLLSL